MRTEEKRIKASREVYSVLARYTNSGASTIVRSVTELDGVEAWARLHAHYSRRELGNIQSATRVHVLKASKGRESIMQWDEKSKAMMSELGGDVKILNLWRMSALSEICPKDVKEQMMMMRLEVAENCENLNAKGVIHDQQDRARTQVDYVSGSEPEEDWQDVDVVRRRSTWRQVDTSTREKSGN